MKKILLTVALIASTTLAFAQKQGEIDAAKANIEKAKAQTENEKKAAKPATWITLAEKYVAAYSLPTANLWIGATKQELDITFKEKPVANPETAVITGQELTKYTYANKDLYFNPQGQLLLMVVTKPVLEEDALAAAVEAYSKANSLDDKGKLNKKISEALSNIKEYYVQDAYNAYNLQDNVKASELFEKVARVSATAPLSQMDTSFLYNAGYTAWASGQLDRAKALFEECLTYGYAYNDGEVYAKLADICGKQKDTLAQQKYLEEGFVKYPTSQSILVNLINFYLTKGDSQARLFELLATAQKNEPTNVSLWYVEGNIHVQLKEYDAALASYAKCKEINPSSEYGDLGEGILYYDRGYATAQEADKVPGNEWKKYDELFNKFVADWKACVAPFERAFELSQDTNIKLFCAERIKNASFRFRTEDENWMKIYEKYNKYFQENQGN